MSSESPGLLAPLSKPTTQTSPHVHSGNAAPMQQGAWISLLIPKEEAEPNQCLSQRCACASSSPRSSQISHHHPSSSGGVNRARSRFFGVTSHVVIVQKAGEAMEKYILPRRGNLYFIMFTVRYRTYGTWTHQRVVFFYERCRVAYACSLITYLRLLLWKL